MKIHLPNITPGPWGNKEFHLFIPEAEGTEEEGINAVAVASLPECLQALANVLLASSDPDSLANALQDAQAALIKAGATITD